MHIVQLELDPKEAVLAGWSSIVCCIDISCVSDNIVPFCSRYVIEDVHYRRTELRIVAPGSIWEIHFASIEEKGILTFNVLFSGVSGPFIFPEIVGTFQDSSPTLREYKHHLTSMPYSIMAFIRYRVIKGNLDFFFLLKFDFKYISGDLRV